MEIIIEGEKYDYVSLVDTKTPTRGIDSFFTQYLLMLGEFEYLGGDNIAQYDENSRNLIYLYFFIAYLAPMATFEYVQKPHGSPSISA